MSTANAFYITLWKSVPSSSCRQPCLLSQLCQKGESETSGAYDCRHHSVPGGKVHSVQAVRPPLYRCQYLTAGNHPVSDTGPAVRTKSTTQRKPKTSGWSCDPLQCRNTTCTRTYDTTSRRPNIAYIKIVNTINNSKPSPPDPSTSRHGLQSTKTGQQ